MLAAFLVAQDWVQWSPLAGMAADLWVALKVAHFLASRVTVHYIRTVLHGVGVIGS